MTLPDSEVTQGGFELWARKTSIIKKKKKMSYFFDLALWPHSPRPSSGDSPFSELLPISPSPSPFRPEQGRAGILALGLG